ncbi:MAG: hypothetical protein II863_11305, partial [Kiritimatiellae bacterium]|nr:hypothetical protein [Kiritimatiellia bacterium]
LGVLRGIALHEMGGENLLYNVLGCFHGSVLYHNLPRRFAAAILYISRQVRKVREVLFSE